MSRQDVLALLREQEGGVRLRRGDQPPAGTEPRGHLEGGGCAAEGRATLWRPAPAGATVCWMRRTC